MSHTFLTHLVKLEKCRDTLRRKINYYFYQKTNFMHQKLKIYLYKFFVLESNKKISLFILKLISK